MSIGLFKKPYIVRTHGEQTITSGYASAPYTFMTVRLNVQPFTTDELMTLPEGERTVKRIKSFGPSKLISADEYSGNPGDYLYYHGLWYECTSSVQWDHTMLRHFRSEFVALPASKQPDPPGEVDNP